MTQHLTSNCMPLGRLGWGGGGGGGRAYMTWLLLATEPSKVVAYPCHYKIIILSSTGLNTSGHHSNNDNSDNLVHGVPEGSWNGFIHANFQLFVAVVSFPDCPTPHQSVWGRDYRGRGYTELGYKFIACHQCMLVTPTPLGSYPDDEIRSGSAG